LRLGQHAHPSCDRPRLLHRFAAVNDVGSVSAQTSAVASFGLPAVSRPDRPVASPREFSFLLKRASTPRPRRLPPRTRSRRAQPAQRLSLRVKVRARSRSRGSDFARTASWRHRRAFGSSKPQTAQILSATERAGRRANPAALDQLLNQLLESVGRGAQRRAAEAIVSVADRSEPL
jgi:hypothetical protein